VLAGASLRCSAWLKEEGEMEKSMCDITIYSIGLSVVRAAFGARVWHDQASKQQGAEQGILFA
jgi:hypothetical protein